MSSRIYERIKDKIKEIIKEEYDLETEVVWTKPPSPKMGDISFPLFNIAKIQKSKPKEIGKILSEKLSIPEFISKLEFRDGFLNIFLKKNSFAKHTLLETIKQPNYGQSTSKSSERIIIEHTSSNPVGPLHIGNVRGSVLGDVLGRLYKFQGAAVNFRYYINDLGRQIAPLIIGYSLLKEKKIKPDSKIDLWIGKIYAIMNTFLEIQQLKYQFQVLNIKITTESKLYELSKKDVKEYHTHLEKSHIEKIEKENLVEWLEKLDRISSSLQKRLPSLYKTLLKLVGEKIEDLNKLTKKYVVKYQEGKDEEIVKIFREVSREAISGHVITLNLFNIFHDDFDWESDVAWSGEVIQILNKLDRKSFLRHDGHARLLANDKIATNLGFKKKYDIKYEIPDLIIVNSEGITLYPCRDIAYHLHKLDKFNATFCYNVISKQQQLPQLTVRLALYALDNQNIADRIYHFDYEYVSLIGRKMAGREFEYVTPDELYEAVKTEVDLLLEERNYSEEESQDISTKVSASSIKYYILKMDPQKTVAFDVKKAVSLNENSGPFLQYSYARALNILKKAKEEKINFQTILDSAQDLKYEIEKKEEWELILLIEELPSIIAKAIDSLRPDSIANFSYSLASAFHKFYDACSVLKAETEELKNTRLILVYSTIKCLESLFEIMGIDTLERM